jgi:chemotaxis protein MotB
MNDPLININQIQEEAKAEIKEEQPWLLTYADMMTLLFAFFVLLFSMSSPDPVKMSQMQDAMEKASGKPGSLQSLSDIKQELEKIVNELNLETTTNVFSDPRGLILEMDGDICFLSGSVSILKDMEKVLEKASKTILNREGDYRMIVIEGHTDSDTIPSYLQEKYPTNWELSASRAAKVVNYLIDQGVNSGRLQASGYADRWPKNYSWDQVLGGKIDDEAIRRANLTQEQKRENRRIRVIIKDDTNSSNVKNL